MPIRKGAVLLKLQDYWRERSAKQKAILAAAFLFKTPELDAVRAKFMKR